MLSGIAAEFGQTVLHYLLKVCDIPIVLVAANTFRFSLDDHSVSIMYVLSVFFRRWWNHSEDVVNIELARWILRA